MNHKWLTALLFGLFLLEGTVLQWIIPASWQGRVMIAPHFVLVLVLYIGLYINRHTALIYGLAFGMLHDFIYYSPMLGPVSFSMGLTGYLAGLLHGRVYSSIVVSMLAIAVGNLAYETIVFGLYRLFRVSHLDLSWLFVHQMLPTMLINLLFALAVYVPVRKRLEEMQASRTATEE